MQIIAPSYKAYSLKLQSAIKCALHISNGKLFLLRRQVSKRFHLINDNFHTLRPLRRLLSVDVRRGCA